MVPILAATVGINVRLDFVDHKVARPCSDQSLLDIEPYVMIVLEAPDVQGLLDECEASGQSV